MTVTRGRPPSHGGGYLAELLDGLPDLRDGACVGHHAGLPPEVWDADPPGGNADKVLAVAACEACPCLIACAAWAVRQPRYSLSGTVAGRNHGNGSRYPHEDEAVAVTAGCATAAAAASRCAVAVSVTAGCATATASAAAAGARCTVTLPGGSAVVIAALPWSAAAGVTAGLAAASAAGAGAAVRTRWSPAQALLADCHRSNRAIAAQTGVNRNAVAAARLALEAAGMIPMYRATPGARTHPIRKPRLRDEIRAMLLACHEQSNKAVARLTGCDKELAGTVRRELEAEGLIPVWLAPRSTRNAWARPGTVRR